MKQIEQDTKKTYVKPELTICEFEHVSIISTSGEPPLYPHPLG